MCSDAPSSAVKTRSSRFGLVDRLLVGAVGVLAAGSAGRSRRARSRNGTVICSTTPSRFTSSANVDELVERRRGPRPTARAPSSAAPGARPRAAAGAAGPRPSRGWRPTRPRARAASRTRRRAGRSSRRATSRRGRCGGVDVGAGPQAVDAGRGPGLGVDAGGEALQPQRLPGAGQSTMRQEMPRAASSSQWPEEYMCSLVESRPFHMIMTGARAVVGGRRLAEVGRQRRALVRDLDPADPRVLEVERLLLQLEDPPVGGEPAGCRARSASARPGTGSSSHGRRAGRPCAVWPAFSACFAPGRRAGRSAPSRPAGSRACRRPPRAPRRP